MTSLGGQLEHAVAACLELTLGVRAAALEPRALVGALRSLRAGGASDAELAAHCEARAPEVLDVLTRALTVNETFFFRSPGQFELIESTIVPRLVRGGRRRIEAWSAGCADGAEAYSLAACLRASAAPEIEISVLGTDVARERLEFARRGSYGVSDLRSSGPLLFPVLKRSGEALIVTPEVKSLVEFSVHNLLDEPPRSGFDLVLCRNVLVYLTAAARARVSANLRRALSPQGVLIVAPADPLAPLSGVAPLGGPEHAAWALTPPAADLAAPPRTRREPEAPVGASVAAPSQRPISPSVALHLQALAHIERGDDAAASRLLHRLLALDPDYIPGLTELALLENRGSRFGEARQLMTRVLRSTQPLPADTVIQGPRPLPVSFYRESAEAFARRWAGL